MTVSICGNLAKALMQTFVDSVPLVKVKTLKSKPSAGSLFIRRCLELYISWNHCLFLHRSLSAAHSG